MDEKLNVSIAAPSDHVRWNAFVDQHPDASVYHRFEWGDVFARAYGCRYVPILATRGTEVDGIAPLVEIDRGPFGRELVSMPYFGHGGAIARNEAAWHGLLAVARKARRELGARHVELRHAHDTPSALLPARADKVLMRMPLEATVADMEKRIGSKLRADVKRPRKEGMTASVGGHALLGHFHDAYAAVMRELGSPCHAIDVFDEALAAFPDRAFIVRVEYQSRTVGAAFLVGHGDTLEVPCAGTLHSLNKLRPNMLLYWTIFCAAIERGYRTFSFGRSTVDAGTYHFKKNWGASPVPLPYHYLLAPDAEAPGAHGENAWMQRASAAWKRLPLMLTNQLGPQLARRLP